MAVIPAQAGIQDKLVETWTPAFARVTIWGLFLILLLPAPLRAASRQLEASEMFRSAVELYQDPQRDKIAATEAFEHFLKLHSDDKRAADAQFMAAEGYFQQGLDALKAEQTKKGVAAYADLVVNATAQKAFANARQAYRTVISKYGKSGLGASAQYRLGEAEYDQHFWTNALAEFVTVPKNFSRSYIVPEAMIGIVYSDLAREDFSEAELHLYDLGESYPFYMKSQLVLYAQGLVSLHKLDYANAEKALQQVSSPEGLFYLGKTYLKSNRPYLAATTFDSLIQQYPNSDLQEETDFFIGDAFFLSKDYDGAMTKYQRFLLKYPDSPLKAAALYRIGSVQFQRKNFPEARASYQTVIDRFTRDDYAPLAQYGVAESYLAAGMMREAMFGYSKVLNQFPGASRIVPLAMYKQAWAQSQMGNYAQAVQTCRAFIAQYPNHELVKNVYLILGNSLLSLGQTAEAVTAWQRIVDVASGTEVAEEAMFLILQSQYDQKNYGSILTSYQFLIRKLPPSQSKWRSLSYLYAADAYLQLNHVDEAQSIYEMILKVYPTEATAVYAQDGIAWCYTYRGEDARALDERKKLKDILAVANSTAVPVGRNELEIADSLFNQKLYDDAFPLYEKFATSYPNAPEAPTALLREGTSLYHLRYYSQAVDTWLRLERTYPQSTEARDAQPQIADTLFRTGKYALSIQAYKTMLAKYPDSPQAPMALLRIAHAAFNSREDAAALREATALIDRFPDAKESSDALDIMEAVFDRSPALKFEATLSAIVSSHPRTHVAAEAQFRLARRLYERKRYDRAAAEFQRFSVDYTDAPQLPRAQFMMAESLLQVGEFQAAISAYQRFLNNFPRSPDTPLALFHLASAHYKLKEFDPAAVNYQRLEEEYPDSEFVKPALFNMALSLKTVGKLDAAQDAYLKYARLVGMGDASSVSALWEVFAIQKDNNNYEGALGTLDQIKASLKPSSDGGIEVAYRTGEVYTAMGRTDDAVAAYKRLKTMRPVTNAFRLQGMIKLAELCEKTEPSAAIAAYEDLARNSPNRKIAQAARERIAALNGKYSMTPTPRRAHKRKAKAAAQEEEAAPEDTGVTQEPADAAPPAPPAAPARKTRKTTQGGQ